MTGIHNLLSESFYLKLATTCKNLLLFLVAVCLVIFFVVAVKDKLNLQTIEKSVINSVQEILSPKGANRHFCPCACMEKGYWKISLLLLFFDFKETFMPNLRHLLYVEPPQIVYLVLWFGFGPS